MKRRLAFCLSFALAGVAWAQEMPEVPPEFAPKPQEDELTPEKAMKLLKEAHELMGHAEDYLHKSSMGSAIEGEKEVMEIIEKLLKEEAGKCPTCQKKEECPEHGQGGGSEGPILKKVEKLLKSSERRQSDAIEKMNEIIKKAKA